MLTDEFVQKETARRIRQEAYDRTFGQFGQDVINRFYLRTFVLLIKVAKGVALASTEQAEAQSKQDMFNWVMAVEDKANDYIANDLPGLARDQQIALDPATDIQWPAQP